MMKPGDLCSNLLHKSYIELIETVFIYKFPKLNSLEVARMLGLGDLKQTRAYQEAQEEKQNQLLEMTVPLLLEKGMTVEEIAQHYKLSIETIQRFVPQN
jgi:predicted transposase YdaD